MITSGSKYLSGLVKLLPVVPAGRSPRGAAEIPQENTIDTFTNAIFLCMEGTDTITFDGVKGSPTGDAVKLGKDIKISLLVYGRVQLWAGFPASIKGNF